MFAVLVEHLKKQVKDLGDEVEILFEVDGGEITSGAKRNLLLKKAKGMYIVFIDADDWVPEYYVSEMLKALETDPDCVAIRGSYTCNGQGEIKWFLSKDFKNETISRNGKNIFLRTTNHITAIKREIAIKHGFPDKSNAEDKTYSEGIHPYLKTEVKVDLPMYEYRYVSYNKTYK